MAKVSAFVEEKSDQSSAMNKLVPFLPLLIPGLIMSVNIACYGMAVKNNQLDPIFPYISDAAGHPPQALFFSIAMDIIAVLVIVARSYRHSQVNQLFVNTAPESVSKDLVTLVRCLNIWATLSAWSMAFGFIVMSLFNSIDHPYIHILGALILFGTTVLVSLYEIWISLLTIPYMNGKLIALIRALVLSWIAGLFSIMILTGCVSVFLFEGDFLSKDRLWWPAEDEGYYWHLASAVAEFLLFKCISLFVLLFVGDMWRCEVGEKVVFLPNEDYTLQPDPITVFGLLGPGGLGRIMTIIKLFLID